MTDDDIQAFRHRYDTMVQIVRAHPHDEHLQAVGALAMQIVKLLVEGQFHADPEDHTDDHIPLH